MKAKILLLLCSIGILSGCACQTTCFPQSSWVWPNFCSFQNYSCSCTDPACGRDFMCLDPMKCCEVFGNVGAGCFEPFGQPCYSCTGMYAPMQPVVPYCYTRNPYPPRCTSCGPCMIRPLIRYY